MDYPDTVNHSHYLFSFELGVDSFFRVIGPISSSLVGLTISQTETTGDSEAPTIYTETTGGVQGRDARSVSGNVRLGR